MLSKDAKTEAILDYLESNLISEGMKLLVEGDHRIFQHGKIANRKIIVLHAVRGDKQYTWGIEFHEQVPDIQTFLNGVTLFKYHINNKTAAEYDPESAPIRRIQVK